MKNYEMDMVRGRVFPKILAFALPLMLTGILQLLFNAADIVVVGQFAGDDSLAAVGSTTSIINLFINIFMGLSIGTNLLVSTAYGAKNYEKIKRTVQTSIATSLILGIVVGISGFILTKPILLLMKTPADVIDKAALYLKIYFLGTPALLLFNYAASVLRAVGDTKRPLYFLVTAGIFNVVLNIIFTVFLRMDVVGVALATIISEFIAAVLVMLCLIKTKACYKYNLKEFKIYGKELIEMIRIGIPAAINGSLFSISNMIIQSAINTFGSVVVAGSSVSASIEGFIYVSMDSVYHATLAFTGQNFGAREYKRLNTILYDALFIVTFLGLSVGFLCLALCDRLFSIYTKSPLVIEAAKTRAWVIIPTYFMCGIMNVFTGSIRGHGYPILPTVISAVGILAIRILWIFTVFEKTNDIKLLYFSWAVSYLVVNIAFTISYIIIHKRIKKKPTSKDKFNGKGSFGEPVLVA